MNPAHDGFPPEIREEPFFWGFARKFVKNPKKRGRQMPAPFRT